MRILAALSALAAILAAPAAQAAKYETIYKFCSDTSCRDGSSPQGPLIADEAGNLYGTASQSGPHRGGVLFELVANADRTAWTYKILYSFCHGRFPTCHDGATPSGRLIRDVNGALYGATLYGGSKNNRGVLFRLAPNADGESWDYQVLHTFCPGVCNDGEYPATPTYEGAETGALYDGHSPLYGVVGGGMIHHGMLYALTQLDGVWTTEIIHEFGFEDGGGPSAPLVYGDTLYAVSAIGGVNDGGTFFRLTKGPHRKWQLTTLYSFGNNISGRASFPSGPLWRDTTGKFVGTAEAGGAIGAGVLYSLTLRDDGTVVERDLYSFCNDGAPCTDGYDPAHGVLADDKNTLIGITRQGGDGAFISNGAGTIYKFRKGAFTQLHAFCAKQGCPDGAAPTALMADGHGNLFGATSNGGNGTYDGTVFKLTP